MINEGPIAYRLPSRYFSDHESKGSQDITLSSDVLSSLHFGQVTDIKWSMRCLADERLIPWPQ